MSEEDLRLLDEYRRSFFVTYDSITTAIVQTLGLKPTGRPAKSTTSVSDKLRRESIRLTQIQDIAGCRLVVDNVEAQDRTIQQLRDLFPRTTTSDRRATPSHGYRAVHVIVSSNDVLVEIQVRTALQHAWAELSEKLSDVVDPAVKYGGGPEHVRSVLDKSAALIAQLEEMEGRVSDLLKSAPKGTGPPNRIEDKVAEVQEALRSQREDYEATLRQFVADVSRTDDMDEN